MYILVNNVNTDWKKFIHDELKKSYFINIKKNLNELNETIYPNANDVFNAFNFFDVKETKVVILGQDPYFNKDEAHGLAFSVKNNKRPPSLNNIFKELYNDLKIKRTNNDLTDWAKQGVLLLNTCLTVSAKKPLSHHKYGWDNFCINVIKKINNECENIVFVLWGNNAKKYKKYINSNRHLIIESAHPSPLSARHGFFNSKPFSKINSFLWIKKNYNIKW